MGAVASCISHHQRPSLEQRQSEQEATRSDSPITAVFVTSASTERNLRPTWSTTSPKSERSSHAVTSLCALSTPSATEPPADNHGLPSVFVNADSVAPLPFSQSTSCSVHSNPAASSVTFNATVFFAVESSDEDDAEQEEALATCAALHPFAGDGGESNSGCLHCSSSPFDDSAVPVMELTTLGELAASPSHHSLQVLNESWTKEAKVRLTAATAAEDVGQTNDAAPFSGPLLRIPMHAVVDDEVRHSDLVARRKATQRRAVGEVSEKDPQPTLHA